VFAVILEELDRHPLADGHEVEAPVAVEIDPNGIRNHAVRLRQLGADLVRHVGEVPAVVSEHITPRRIGIIPRRHPAANEEIGRPSPLNRPPRSPRCW